MAKRTPAQVYADAIAAGFDAAAATTLTAIAGAESSYDDAALGDTGLQTSLWGPSYGLFQIRTQKPQTGTGGTRDIAALTGDDIAQARAAYTISGGGKDFTPWTTFTSGKYQSFLPAATTAAHSTPTPLPTIGPSWLPWNWGADAGNAVLGGARNIVVEAVFVGLGLALLATGLVVAVKPQRAIGKGLKLARAVI